MGTFKGVIGMYGGHIGFRVDGSGIRVEGFLNMKDTTVAGLTMRIIVF